MIFLGRKFQLAIFHNTWNLGEQQSFVASTWKVTGTLLAFTQASRCRFMPSVSISRNQIMWSIPTGAVSTAPVRRVRTYEVCRKKPWLKNWSLHLVNVWYSFRFWPPESFENLLYLRIWRLAKGRTKLGRRVERRMFESWIPRIFYCARPAYRCLSWVVQAAVEFGCSSLEHGHISRVIVVE